MLTLESLQYTTGMGFVCGPDGALLVLRPFSPMWIGPPDSSYLRRACFNCHCTNIAPDEPQPPAVQRPACVVDIGEDEVVGPVPSYPPNPQCKISTTASGDLVEEDDPPLYDLYRCNEYMYGKPIFADCDDAYDEMERYQNAWEAAQPADKVNYRPATFVGIGRLADFNSVYGANYDPELVQLPVARTNGKSHGLVTSPLVRSLLLRYIGTCTITIMQLERRHMPIFATEDWDTLLVNMQDVMFNCVEDQGIGGWVETGKSRYMFERFVWLNITQATLELVKTPHWGSSSMVPTPDSSNSSTSNSHVRPTPREMRNVKILTTTTGPTTNGHPRHKRRANGPPKAKETPDKADRVTPNLPPRNNAKCPAPTHPTATRPTTTSALRAPPSPTTRPSTHPSEPSAAN